MRCATGGSGFERSTGRCTGRSRPTGSEWAVAASRPPHPFDLTRPSRAVRRGHDRRHPRARRGGVRQLQRAGHRRAPGASRSGASPPATSAWRRRSWRRRAATRSTPTTTTRSTTPTRPSSATTPRACKHDSLGDPDPVSYGTLLRALQSEDPADFEEIQPRAPPPRLKLTNPQSGLAFDVEGPDAQELTMPPAPRFDSEETAHEMGELYWMALARDVPFASYAHRRRSSRRPSPR